ncbi:unnamed protein product [Notodromas monacha]|uniref:Uncharacterized protein n=1 Tax=Notodromas monacha TaxID=399045 RepID=A0A7R9GI92_9CRUS|nr:unnamed protein product [Notodromas monacha]CAG0922353.1 unnamed protein product [Notodromas monacha]
MEKIFNKMLQDVAEKAAKELVANLTSTSKPAGLPQKTRQKLKKKPPKFIRDDSDLLFSIAVIVFGLADFKGCPEESDGAEVRRLRTANIIKALVASHKWLLIVIGVVHGAILGVFLKEHFPENNVIENGTFVSGEFLGRPDSFFLGGHNTKALTKAATWWSTVAALLTLPGDVTVSFYGFIAQGILAAYMVKMIAETSLKRISRLFLAVVTTIVVINVIFLLAMFLAFKLSTATLQPLVNQELGENVVNDPALRAYLKSLPEKFHFMFPLVLDSLVRRTEFVVVISILSKRKQSKMLKTSQLTFILCMLLSQPVSGASALFLVMNYLKAFDITLGFLQYIKIFDIVSIVLKILLAWNSAQLVQHFGHGVIKQIWGRVMPTAEDDPRKVTRVSKRIGIGRMSVQINPGTRVKSASFFHGFPEKIQSPESEIFFKK